MFSKSETADCADVLEEEIVSVLPKKILLATDGSEDAALAARATVDVARGAGAELHVVHAWHSVPSSRFEGYIRTGLGREARRLLEDQVSKIEALGGKVSGAHLKYGSPVEEILDACGNVGADLLVMGGRGRGPISRLLLGSTTEGVVFNSRSPVLVVRGGEDAWPPERVIVADDSSEGAKRAGELAVALGKLFAAKNLLMRVYSQLPETNEEGRRMDARLVNDELRREEEVLEARARELEEFGDRPRVCIAVGDPATVVLEEAAERGAPERALVAAGKRGLGFAGRMRLGSASTKLLRLARGPVLIHPGADR